MVNQVSTSQQALQPSQPAIQAEGTLVQKGTLVQINRVETVSAQPAVQSTQSDLNSPAAKPRLDKIAQIIDSIRTQEQQVHQTIKDWVMAAPEAEVSQRMKFMQMLNNTAHTVCGDQLFIHENLNLQGFDRITSLPTIKIDVGGHAIFKNCKNLESISNMTVHENFSAENCESLNTIKNVHVDFGVNLSGCKSMTEMPACFRRIPGSLNISYSGIGSLEGIDVHNCIYAEDKPELAQVSRFGRTL